MSAQGADRRRFLKSSLAGATVGALCVFTSEVSLADKPGVSVAGYDYDRVRGIMDGQVGIKGADVNFTVEDIYSLNQYVFGPEAKYDVSEIGLIPFVSKYINEDFRAYTLVPVFISRTFRHRNIYVRTDADIETPGDLRGKRVGTPGYGMSANTWIRGFLLDEYGVKADDMQWIETTLSSDKGKLDKSGWGAFDEEDSPFFFPENFPLVQGPPGVDESELLLSGGCDALITAIPPKAFLEGDRSVKRLFADPQAAEMDYYRKTGLFPIMHAIAIRTDVIEDNPGLPAAVFNMYSQAKQIAYENLRNTGALKVTLPWGPQEFDSTRELMGDNYWKYGIEANRKELEAVMRYTHEQGLVKERIGFEELFHPSTLSLEEVST